MRLEPAYLARSVSLEEHGVRRYPFGLTGMLDLKCNSRNSRLDRPSIEIHSNIPLTLEVIWEGGTDHQYRRMLVLMKEKRLRTSYASNPSKCILSRTLYERNEDKMNQEIDFCNDRLARDRLHDPHRLRRYPENTRPATLLRYCRSSNCRSGDAVPQPQPLNRSH